MCRQLASQFTAEFGARLDGYSARVERSFRESLGRCDPISTVYNSTTVTLCSNVIYPFVSDGVGEFRGRWGDSGKKHAIMS